MNLILFEAAELSDGELRLAGRRAQHIAEVIRPAVGDALREGSIQVIELQAAMIVGPGSAAFGVIRDLVNYLPVIITPKWVRNRSTPIALETEWRGPLMPGSTRHFTSRSAAISA